MSNKVVLANKSVVEIVLDSGIVLDTTLQYVVHTDSWPAAYAYTGSNLTTTTLTDPASGNVFVQTLGYNGSNQVTSNSGWVKQ
jgi:hypothetical protein